MSDLPPLTPIQLGLYKHYKGNLYEVVGVVRHSESLEQLVLYKALYGEQGLWVRPFEMFVSNIEIDGKVVRRFAPTAG